MVAARLQVACLQPRETYTPFFVDSRASRLVQIADHVAYSVFRRYNSGDAHYFDIIAHRFDTVDNVIHGLVHKHAERHA